MMKFRKNKYKRVKWIDSRYGVKDYIRRKAFYSAMMVIASAQAQMQVNTILATSGMPIINKKLAVANGVVAGMSAIVKSSNELRERFNLDYRPQKYKVSA